MYCVMAGWRVRNTSLNLSMTYVPQAIIVKFFGKKELLFFVN